MSFVWSETVVLEGSLVRKKTAYGRYKEKCKEITEHTKRGMQRTKERMNNESRTQNIT